jgi:hypothetical protein
MKRSNISTHLYKNKKPCPTNGQKDTLELNDTIRQFVMDNRIYIKPDTSPKEQIVSQQNFINIINNQNTILNFIDKMDPIKKFVTYAEYSGLRILPFEDKVDTLYQETVELLENDGYRFGFNMNQDNLLKVIDEVSGCSNNIDSFDIVYDKASNKIKIFDGTSFNEYLPDRGITEILDMLCTYYLYSVEKYLIREIESDKLSEMERRKKEDTLVEHLYTFLACFHIEPYVRGKNDHQILYNSDDDRYHRPVSFTDVDNHKIADKYDKLYLKADGKLTRTMENKIKKDVLEIIKRNSAQNIKQLNESILALIHVNDDFKKKLIEDRIDVV